MALRICLQSMKVLVIELDIYLVTIIAFSFSKGPRKYKGFSEAHPKYKDLSQGSQNIMLLMRCPHTTKILVRGSQNITVLVKGLKNKSFSREPSKYNCYKQVPANK